MNGWPPQCSRRANRLVPSCRRGARLILRVSQTSSLQRRTLLPRPTFQDLSDRLPHLNLAYEFLRFRYDGRLVDSTFRFASESHLEGERVIGIIVRQCVRCSRLSVPGPCANCGNDLYRFAICGELRSDGVACDHCDIGCARWDCPECLASSPYSKTLMVIGKK